MAQVKHHPQILQTGPPGAQERRGFHRLGEDPAAGADKSLRIQPIGPAAQIGRAESVQIGFEPARPVAITLIEGRPVFGVRQVKPAAAGHEQFPPQRRHAFEDVHAVPASREMLCGDQAGGAAADNGCVGV